MSDAPSTSSSSSSRHSSRGSGSSDIAEKNTPSTDPPVDIDNDSRCSTQESDVPIIPEAVAPPLYDDPSDEDDGEGEWITPTNASTYKTRELGLIPSSVGPDKKQEEPVGVGCMTADFAMQNVLLQMGLDLVGLEGRRIERIKTWVLRCHACFESVLFPSTSSCHN